MPRNSSELDFRETLISTLEAAADNWPGSHTKWTYPYEDQPGTLWIFRHLGDYLAHKIVTANGEVEDRTFRAGLNHSSNFLFFCAVDSQKHGRNVSETLAVATDPRSFASLGRFATLEFYHNKAVASDFGMHQPQREAAAAYETSEGFVVVRDFKKAKDSEAGRVPEKSAAQKRGFEGCPALHSGHVKRAYLALATIAANDHTLFEAVLKDK